MRQAEEIRQLKDEVARLKGNPARPSLKPGTTIDIDKLERQKKRRIEKKYFKKKAKKNLVIHNIENVELTVIPEGSVAICSESIKVQDILIRPNNTQYTRKAWKTSDGKIIRAKWPEHIDGQFGFHLKSYIPGQSS